MSGRAAGMILVAVLAASDEAAAQADPYAPARERMVRDDIAAGGVTDPRVLESMRLTPRHEFVPVSQRAMAYFDMSLPIGESQTISGPFVVASMTEKLEPKPTDRVLEIGTGSGYQAAVLSPLVGTVYSIEIHRELGERAAKTLKRLGYRNVVTRIGDGFAGWPEHAPFDKIIVTCSPEEVPKPLVDQLAEGGMMVIPVGERYEQMLVRLTKRDGVLVRETLAPSLFVPMTGAAEEARQVQPDGGRPTLANAGFEEIVEETKVPTAWYYGRQIEIIETADAPEGRRHLRLENSQPGRPAHLFQGFPVDGRKVRQLGISLSVRGEGLRQGLAAAEVPAVAVTFYDERRARSSRVTVAPSSTSADRWQGSFGWRRAEGTVAVPAWAREAIVQVGMMGATGRLDVDDVLFQSVPIDR
ncbi:MAG: protein-L-isoaspartate(D-aspartate) O-methyltransferase [Planctomycetia bacterium]